MHQNFQRVKSILFLVVTSQFFGFYKIWLFWLQSQMQNMISNFYYFCQSFCYVTYKNLSSFTQWTSKLPGVGCLGEEWKFCKEISQKSIDLYIYFFFGSLYSLLCEWGNELNLILGHSVPWTYRQKDKKTKLGAEN